MHSPTPLTREVVLIGGGHAHALVLRQWAMKPLAGARLTLISPDPTAPYTGMLPGFVAGHYPKQALMIDLIRLARCAGARLVLGRAIGLDLAVRTVEVPGRPPIKFDIASLDIGITSDLPDLPGFDKFGVPAKPLGRFAERWEALVKDPPAFPKIVILGGGVGGVELALAAAFRLGSNAFVTVIESKSEVLSVLPAATRKNMLEAIGQHEIEIKTNACAREIKADRVILEDGTELDADLVIGATGARPQEWLKSTGLSLHEGFVEVDHWLRSKTDSSVYAVGDCAHLSFSPRPKAGVYAVRQAPILFRNIRADLTGSQRKLYTPQNDYLKLISIGGKNAVLDRSGVALKGAWAWRLKDRIDRAFMEKFATLTPMTPPQLPREIASGVKQEVLDKPPLCGGCGAKVGPKPLFGALAKLPSATRSDIVTASGDDAAVLRCGTGYQVISTDHLRAFVDDPYLMTKIALQHAMGDIWAMGASPQVGLAQVTLPRASEFVHAQMLDEIIQAAETGLAEIGAELVGGHTSVGAELTIGFTVTGLREEKVIGLEGAKQGDHLVLTRPLGTGVLLAAEMQALAQGEDIATLWKNLSKSQREIAETLASCARAMTDVTGFGLAGHTSRLCAASGVGAEISLSSIPLWSGALDAVEAGVASSIYAQNRADLPEYQGESARAKLLFDPQTAGGLLAAVPPDVVPPNTWTIGKITEKRALSFVE